MTAFLAALPGLLKDNKSNLGWTAVCLVMVLAAYLAQGDKIEKLSLEVGELRATAKYQEQALKQLTELCSED